MKRRDFIGGLTAFGMAGCLSTTTSSTTWNPGHYQVHFIYSGRGESMFHIFPDGSSMLLDCGDTMRFVGTVQAVPLPNDASIRRAGEFVARYVQAVNPHGSDVDYFQLSHYHDDHGGGQRYHGGTLRLSSGECKLSGFADASRFLHFKKIVDRAWPNFDDPRDARADSRCHTPQNVEIVYRHLMATQGTKVERFELGRRNQIGPGATYPNFSIFNLCVNGRIAMPDGSVRDLYAHLPHKGGKPFNENAMSCGMLITYGKFRYFTAGDFSDCLIGPDKKKLRAEDALADAVGPVSVAKVCHHGHCSMTKALVRALRPRVWTACTLDQAHMTDDTMALLADRSAYPDERMILPTYMPQEKYWPVGKPTKPRDRSHVGDVPAAVRNEPCHVVLDVAPDGETYSFDCVAATRQEMVNTAHFDFQI